MNRQRRMGQLKQQQQHSHDVVRARTAVLAPESTTRTSKLTVGPLTPPGGTGVANDTLLFDVHNAGPAPLKAMSRGWPRPSRCTSITTSRCTTACTPR